MSSRRIASITREGYYYLFILAFIAGGAIMRQINPLFALAGLMMAPLIFNWRLATTEIRGLRVVRRIPRITAGETLIVDMDLKNERGAVSAWQVRISERVSRIEAGKRVDEDQPLELIVPHVPARGSARVSYRCQLYQRGEYRVGPATISTGFPFGLVAVKRRLDVENTLLVAPRMGKMGEAWRRYTREDRKGTQGPSYRRGAVDGDFYALRAYRSGDPPRSIHWRSSARLGQLMVKQVEQRSDRQITLLIDLWQPENPTEADREAVEMAASFTATAVADLCRASGGRLTLSVAALESFYYSGGLSPALRNTILDYLSVATACEKVDPFSAWLEAGAGGGGGSTDAALLISTRPVDGLHQADGEYLPGWTAKVPRISVRSSDFQRWFRWTDRVVPKSSMNGTAGVSK